MAKLTEEQHNERAVFVGVIKQGDDERQIMEYLDELEFLAETAGAIGVKKFIQKVDRPDSRTYIRSGKLQEIKQYIEEYKYSYSGIRKALIYFYEVKGNDKQKANGSIGIVPYIYKEAYNYYYSIWLANQNNKDKVIENYVPTQKVIHIPVPQRNLRKRKLFSFLDEENIDGE